MASALYKKFATDDSLSELGVWTNFGDGILVRIRRIRAQASVNARKALDKQHTNEIRRGTLDDATLKDLGIRQIAHGVISAWEGIEDQDGNPVEFTPEAAYKILCDLPDFAEAILGVSMDAESYRGGAVEDAKGN